MTVQDTGKSVIKIYGPLKDVILLYLSSNKLDIYVKVDIRFYIEEAVDVTIYIKKA